MSTEAVIALVGVSATILGLLGGILYNSGRQSARIDALDKFRDETVADLKAMRILLENINGAIGARKISRDA